MEQNAGESMFTASPRIAVTSPSLERHEILNEGKNNMLVNILVPTGSDTVAQANHVIPRNSSSRSDHPNDDRLLN